MNKYCFIVNPISGIQQKAKVTELIQKICENKSVNFEIWQTTFQSRGDSLAKEAIEKKFTHVVAIGGDGTVHEVGAQLIGTKINLCIIPMGSGNGLARSLNIPLHPKKALLNALNGQSTLIDTLVLNKKPFLNIAGIGFDAFIADEFSKTKKRGFKSYVREVWKAYRHYNQEQYTIKLNHKTIETSALMLSIANAQQFGNNAHIAPMANLKDGIFEICLLKKFPFYAIIPIIFKLFTKNIHTSRYFTFYQTTKCNITHSGNFLHLDGEPIPSQKNIEISISPLSLNITIPKYSS